MIDYRDRIVSTPGIMGGKPCVRGTRVRVRDVLSYLAGGDSIDAIVAAFPYLTHDDVVACLAFAADHSDHPVLVAAE